MVVLLSVVRQLVTGCCNLSLVEATVGHWLKQLVFGVAATCCLWLQQLVFTGLSNLLSIVAPTCCL